MPILTKEQFKQIRDRETVEVDMSAFQGWEGITVLLRPMSGDQRAEMEREWLALPDGEQLPPHFKERVLCRCIVDGEKNEVFTPDDLEDMAQKSGRAIDFLYKRAAKMNGLEKDAVEQAAKN